MDALPVEAAVEFSVQTRQVGERLVVLHLAGELDMATGPTLQGVLATAVGGGATDLVIDMTELAFIDSTGLGLLVSGSRMLPPGGAMRVVVTSPGIRKLFAVTGLDRMLALFDNLDDATGASRLRDLPRQDQPAPKP